jgi:hypothetical protein
MRIGRKSGTGPIGLGIRALKGGGVVVGVVVDEGEPRVVLSTFLPTAAASDRLALEPYRVAYEMKRGPDGSFDRGRGRRRRGTQTPRRAGGEGSGRYRPQAAGRRMPAGHCGAARQSRRLDQRRSGVQSFVAGACADRRRTRCAGRASARVRPMRPRSRRDTLHEVASEQLRLSPHDMDVRLKSLGATVGKPWRREQKLACLSAWVTVTALQ